MKKIRWNIAFVTSILGICSVLTIRVSLNIVRWTIDGREIQKQLEDIKKVVKVEKVAFPDEVDVVEPEGEIQESDPYWDYIKTDLISVDFDELNRINPDTKGWISMNGTNINYPFVQTTDNEYYLSHSFNKSFNMAGWVFMDYRNTYENKNTILYAHGRTDGSMFGSLKHIFTDAWFAEPNNRLIKISTPLENSVWQIFSLYRIPTTNDYLQTDFGSDEEFLEFTDTLKNRSVEDLGLSINKEDKILTLSTCYDASDKVVVHAKLIKREIR